MSDPKAPSFHELEIAEIRAETRELTHVKLHSDSAEFRAAYQFPGQYVQIKAGSHKPGFFAISSAPERDFIELLIKRGSPIADAIIEHPAGAKLLVSNPSGKGYPLDQALGRELLLVGVGSGIAPLRSVVHAILLKRSAFKRVGFIYGARTRCAIPYQAEMDLWPDQGIEVTRICSQPLEGSWAGPVGRVHDAMIANPKQVAAASAIFVCGMKAMVEDVKSTAEKLGLPRERVFQNF